MSLCYKASSKGFSFLCFFSPRIYMMGLGSNIIGILIKATTNIKTWMIS